MNEPFFYCEGQKQGRPVQYLQGAAPPGYRLQIVRFKDPAKLAAFITQKQAAGGFIGAQVPGFCILLIAAGSNTPAPPPPLEICHAAAAYYLTSKILPNARHYKKYREA